MTAEPLPGGRTADVGEAKVDLDRRRRCGYPEVIYGAGKTAATLEKIIDAQLAHGDEVFATRINASQAEVIVARHPTARYNATARTLRVPALATAAKEAKPAKVTGRVAIVSAGSSDLPVAEEARETAAWMGCETVEIVDVGVAGPHRLPEQLDKLLSADAIVVVAGMEGALPSVVAGYVACPVIAVPTSVGYGANFGGVAALLSMLNSCAANVAVVNIDAGFKGGYLAAMIAQRKHH
ncbi:MAG: nickel pincer cofactor biosynthesis protein LarB [Planctomycetes bacterium]|nr:nickel pincer cofactor biosynthesis protein LarB [Planctomycetota bacterium]